MSKPDDTELDEYSVTIKCPECNTVQAAVVQKTIPFWTYVHECISCKYVIGESEWVEVVRDNGLFYNE